MADNVSAAGAGPADVGSSRRLAALRVGALDGLGLVAAGSDNSAQVPAVALRECQPASITLLRGDGGPSLLAAVRSACELDLPARPRSSSANDAGCALWLGPDEWLLARQREPLRIQLLADTAVCVDVSDAYTVMRLQGQRAVDVLAKTMSVDLHARAFPIGSVVRTAFARIQAIVHHQGHDTFDVYVGRSFARYAWCWLADAAAEYGNGSDLN